MSSHLLVIYLESTAVDTEGRLLERIKRACPDIPNECSLSQSFAMLRSKRQLSNGRKVVIVLDQFEQWLHAKQIHHDAELARALRQCDGQRLQVILLVRDDFWMRISRLMREIEFTLTEGGSSTAIDLVDPDHARKVLVAFGRALECLPQHGALTHEQEAFIERAMSELAREDSVIPVRLSLFADMLKKQPWTPQTLKRMGGVEGVGVTFLEETFHARSAPPQHRVHQVAARKVLQALLPEHGLNMKGQRRSRQELLAVSGYQNHPSYFDELIGILDTELRLITPSDVDNDLGTKSEHDIQYQLTHDYLVPSLQEWLTQKQKETSRGRAQLRLEELANSWKLKRQARWLPSLREWLSISLWTSKENWNKPQRQMMLAAAKLFCVRSIFIVLVFCIVGLVGMSMKALERKKQADVLVDIVLRSEPEEVPNAVEKLRGFQSEARPILRELIEQSDDQRHRFRAAIALGMLGEVQEEVLINHLAEVSQEEYANLVSVLEMVRESVVDKIYAKSTTVTEVMQRLRFACLLLQFEDPRAARDCLQLQANPKCRTQLIHRLKEYQVDISRLINAMKKSDDADLESGICAAIGLMSLDKFSKKDFTLATEWLKERYQNSPHGGAHSAARWSLTFWKVPLPELIATREAPDNRGWFHNRHGLIMVKIPAGSYTMGLLEPLDSSMPVQTNDILRPHKVEHTKPFFIATSEVTVELYYQFLNDPLAEKPPLPFHYNKELSPHDYSAINGPSWYDAVLFCNWLSRRENRTPCYRRNKTNPNEWDCDFDADGYRLPTEAEWEYACKARSTAHFHFGYGVEWISIYEPPHISRSVPLMSGVPNGWGLHDVHASQWEWMWDWVDEEPDVNGRMYAERPDEPIKDPRGAVTGKHKGIRSYSMLKPDWRRFYSVHRGHGVPSERFDMYGIRVACNATTLPTPPPDPVPKDLVLKQLNAKVHDIELSPDGQWIASANGDTVVRLWDIATGSIAKSCFGHPSRAYCVARSPDGERIISGGKESHLVRVWNSKTGEELHQLEGSEARHIYCVKYSPDGKWIVAGGAEGKLVVWKVSPNGVDRKKPILTLKGHTGHVWELAFSPDGKHLASAASNKWASKRGELIIWDIETGKLIHKLDAQMAAASDVVYSPDGTQIVTSGGGRRDDQLKNWFSGEIIVWDARKGERIRTLECHSDFVKCLAFSPDGKRLVTGSADHSVKIFDVETWKEIHTLKGHTNILSGVAYSSDGKYIFTSADDGTIRVWDAATGKVLPRHHFRNSTPNK